MKNKQYCIKLKFNDKVYEEMKFWLRKGEDINCYDSHSWRTLGEVKRDKRFIFTENDLNILNLDGRYIAVVI